MFSTKSQVSLKCLRLANQEALSGVDLRGKTSFIWQCGRQHSHRMWRKPKPPRHFKSPLKYQLAPNPSNPVKAAPGPPAAFRSLDWRHPLHLLHMCIATDYSTIPSLEDLKEACIWIVRSSTAIHSQRIQRQHGASFQGSLL
jgi:hypothetical protein